VDDDVLSDALECDLPESIEPNAVVISARRDSLADAAPRKAAHALRLGPRPLSSAHDLGLATFDPVEAALEVLHWLVKKADQVADGAVPISRVAKRQARINLISVATSVACLREIARCDKVGDDIGGRPLRDPHTDSDVAEPSRRVDIYAFEHVRMVGHEPPAVLNVGT